MDIFPVGIQLVKIFSNIIVYSAIKTEIFSLTIVVLYW